MIKEFGDFQTPPQLVSLILKAISFNGTRWNRVLEPTCGQGNFISGLLDCPVPPQEIQGIEIQRKYIQSLNNLSQNDSEILCSINAANIFKLNLTKDLQWRNQGSLLVVGNPPWVTNSQLGIEESNNIPDKTNLKNLSGMEALTGSSNFDIAEYIWIKLIKELIHQTPTIALICKTSVARNILQFAFDNALPITDASMRMIDAKKWFGVAVSACLFYVQVGREKPSYTAAIYPDLQATLPSHTLGIVDGKFVANISTYFRSSFVEGNSSLNWRQGLKHDAASVMELSYNCSGLLQNKLGKTVCVESEYVYPLLKSSDVFHEKKDIIKAVIVTQKNLKDDTFILENLAPKLWQYLQNNKEFFEKRKSKIYDNKPPFSIFGIGKYSFSPYKVGISGLHKLPKFRAIGLVNSRPVMLDDTCYFIPCYSPEQAALLVTLLNNSICLDFINSRFFPDGKRPITKKLLQRIDLKALLNCIDSQILLSKAEIEFMSLVKEDPKKPHWESSLDELLIDRFM